MLGVLLFNSCNSLDFEDVRRQVIRIPEVLGRLQEAQKIWEDRVSDDFNFLDFISSEDEQFFRSSALKSLAMAVVQVGLFDRATKKQGAPQFIVGNVRNESPALFAAGKQSFEELLLRSRASGLQTSDSGLGGGLNLQGQALPEFQVFQLEGENYQSLAMSSTHVHQLLGKLAEERGVRRMISVGPGSLKLGQEQRVDFLSEVDIQESIDMDPLLNWFWPQVQSISLTA